MTGGRARLPLLCLLSFFQSGQPAGSSACLPPCCHPSLLLPFPCCLLSLPLPPPLILPLCLAAACLCGCHQCNSLAPCEGSLSFARDLVWHCTGEHKHAQRSIAASLHADRPGAAAVPAGSSLLLLLLLCGSAVQPVSAAVTTAAREQRLHHKQCPEAGMRGTAARAALQQPPCSNWE